MLLKLGKLLSYRNFTKSLHSSVTMTSENGLTLSKVVSTLDACMPLKLSESWDNTGLLVEPYTPRLITKIFLTNDLTEDVALEAKNQDCEMIISYHPPIFVPLKSVNQSTWKERIVSLLLENRIALFSPHTSWDSANGGVNDWLASCFNAASTSPINNGPDPSTGAGRIVQLDKNISLLDAINAVKKLTGVSFVRFALGKDKKLESEIKSVALCAGSGSSVLKGVDADLYLTGEMLHHDVLDATQKGISVILTNHSDSERGFLKVFSAILENKLDNKVSVIVSKLDKDPLITL